MTSLCVYYKSNTPCFSSVNAHLIWNLGLKSPKAGLNVIVLGAYTILLISVGLHELRAGLGIVPPCTAEREDQALFAQDVTGILCRMKMEV